MSYKDNALNALFLHIITFSLPLFNSSITKLPNEFSRDLAIQILQHTNNITLYMWKTHTELAIHVIIIMVKVFVNKGITWVIIK